MKTKKCVWTSEVESSYRETDCGTNVYIGSAGGPKADGMIYCAWCGKPIKEKRVVISEEKP